MIFELSRDYKRAWDLIQEGDRLACWVDMDKHNRGIARAFYQKRCLSTVIADRYHLYLDLFEDNNLETFAARCTEMNAEFYLPIPNNMIVISQEDFEALASKVIKERVGNPLDELLESMEAISNGNQ